MSSLPRLLLAPATVTILMLAACSQTSVYAQHDASNLAETARHYADGYATHAQTVPVATPEDWQNSDSFQTEISLDVVQGKFDELDKTARQLRETKARYSGGIWKLFMFYEGTGSPVAGKRAVDDDWKFHISKLEEWVKARPQSAAARIGLASAYEGYADFARGTGYANTVTDKGWELYSQRFVMAASVLVDAAKLNEKCPEWFEEMQHVALAQGWSQAQARELLDAAIAFEPGWYHYYREYTNFILPKWYGQPGEAEEFVEDISTKIGGDQGKFLYFELGSMIACQCDSDDAHLDTLSWPRLKEGYATLVRLYGVSSLKANRFAHIAVAANDREAAQQAFSTIGENWDHIVWGREQNFDAARRWAQGQ